MANEVYAKFYSLKEPVFKIMLFVKKNYNHPLLSFISIEFPTTLTIYKRFTLENIVNSFSPWRMRRLVK